MYSNAEFKMIISQLFRKFFVVSKVFFTFKWPSLDLTVNCIVSVHIWFDIRLHKKLKMQSTESESLPFGEVSTHSLIQNIFEKNQFWESKKLEKFLRCTNVTDSANWSFVYCTLSCLIKWVAFLEMQFLAPKVSA